ncbi:hypothetical protein BGX27_003930, partial [Mortierella sp. AM989]
AVFWEEAPMQYHHVFEAIYRTLHAILRNDEPFDGKVLVFGGYFRECEGSLPSTQLGTTSNYVRIPDELIFHPTNPTILNSPVKQLIKAVYPAVETARPHPEVIIK